MIRRLMMPKRKTKPRTKMASELSRLEIEWDKLRKVI